MKYFPKIPNTAKILILGTYPSVPALENEEYYKDPKNSFWSVLEDVLEEKGLKDTSYKYKEDILKKYGIVLWDSIAECEREKSSDANIIEETARPNNLSRFLQKTARNIEIIIINGVTERSIDNKLGAKGWFEKFYGKISEFEATYNVKVVCLHSTAYRAKSSFNLSEWRENILPYLLQKPDTNKKKAFVVKKQK